MDILDAIHMMYLFVLAALLVVPDYFKKEKKSGNPNTTGTAHDTYPKAATPVAAMSACGKLSGDLNATGTAHHTYPKVAMPARKKPNILEWLLNSTGCMVGLVVSTSALSIYYFFLMLWKELWGLLPVFLTLFCSPFVIIISVLWYFTISSIYYLVTMLILKIINRKIPDGAIYRTAAYAGTPMFVVTTFLVYYSYTFLSIGIAITAGLTAVLMFLATRHMLKEQEFECNYMSIATRQHFRQHGFIHVAF